MIPVGRLIAALGALVGLTGLGVQLATSTDFLGSFGSALWGMARYYTNIGNLLVACILLGVALGRPLAARPLLLGGALVNAGLIGIVYLIMLSDVHHDGESPLAMILLHYVVPPLVALYWLGFAPRGLKWRDPLLWAAPPLTYFAYVLTRAEFDGRYPYPFIDVAEIGWAQTLVNASVITLAFVLAGLALVMLDRLLVRARLR